MQRPDVMEAGRSPKTAALDQRGASLKELRAADSSLVCEVVYLNLNASVDRRLGMEGHLQELGLKARRFPALEFEVEQSPSGIKNFTAKSTEILLDVFAEWGCGNWTEANCTAGDQLCCKGLMAADGYGWHMTAGNGSSMEKTELLPLLSHTASFVTMLKQMRGITAADGCAGVMILEDDARLDPDWLRVTSEAVAQAPDFDIIKLQSTADTRGLGPSQGQDCLSSCSNSGVCVYDMGLDVKCLRFSTAAGFYNWRHVERILRAIEVSSQRYMSMVYDNRVAASSWIGSKRYDVDLLFGKAALVGGLRLYDVDPPGAYISQGSGESTFSGAS